MKTFKAKLSLDVKIVVPDQFITQMRKDGASGLAVFIGKMHEAHPTNDEAFIEAVLSNGLRTSVKANLLELFANSGLGGTVSPAKIDIVGQAPDHDAPTNVHTITRDKLVAQAPDSAVVSAPPVEVGAATAAALAVTPPPGMGGYSGARSHGGCD